MNKYNALFADGTMETIEADVYHDAQAKAIMFASMKNTTISTIIGDMNKIEFSTDPWIKEVENFGRDTEVVNHCVESYAIADRLLSTDFFGVHGMIVSDDVFAWIDHEYGINKIKQGE